MLNLCAHPDGNPSPRNILTLSPVRYHSEPTNYLAKEQGDDILASRIHHRVTRATMKQNLPSRIRLLLKDYQHRLLFGLISGLQPVYRKLFPSNVAYIFCDHPVLTPFIIKLNTKLRVRVHLLKADEDFSSYAKVIVPNGMWSHIRGATERIPPAKRVYCEVGFFPQNRNVYLDEKGVHGNSSIRDSALVPLNPAQKQELQDFRDFYVEQNYVKLRWDTVPSKGNTDTNAYRAPFVFIPLQLESDTAFQLCPFDSNQDMISAIEQALPDKHLIFKVHPWDDKSSYRVSARNRLLPHTNTDLKALIQQCESVVNCNSTVMLEALLFGKKCASLGTGFATNHHVALECQDDMQLLAKFDHWKPDQDKVDSFLYLLISRQMSIEFWKDAVETQKLRSRLLELGIY